MAAYGSALILVLLMAPATHPVKATDAPPIARDLLTAIKDMQRANYYTFSVLIKLSPPILFQGNLTFLMPSDRALSTSGTIMPRTSVPKFLFLHSISSPLLFEHLQYLPTGSILPTSEPNFVVKVRNGGHRSFYLNNAHIVSPNICSGGSSSIRCHGIDNVLLPMFSGSAVPSLPNCSVNRTDSRPASPVVANPPPRLPAPMRQPPMPPVLGLNSTPPVHSNAPSVKSGTSQLLPEWYEGLVLAAVMFSVLGCSIDL